MNGYYHPNYYNSKNRRQQKCYQDQSNYYGYNNYYQMQYPPYGFGTLTPIQRAFHDAIYEEEYGSDDGNECCQNRGMSAIFCWFLSVIILIGLAASVVLTVFFLVKSKNHITQNGELDLYEGVNGINNFNIPVPTTTELNKVSSAISSKESKSRNRGRGGGKSSSEEDETDLNKSASRHSTRFPPSRKGPHQIFQESSEEEPPLKFQDLYPNGKFTSSEVRAKLNPLTPSHNSEESSSSSSEESSPLLTTTPITPVQNVLFTAPPLSAVTNGNRRNLQTTRFPTGRTSFTTSTEALESDRGDNEEEDEDHESGHNHHLKDDDKDTPSATNSSIERNRNNKDEDDSAIYKGEESQLNKMLLDEIPPHSVEHIMRDKNQEPTEFKLPDPVDPLTRIIKNMAPRWGRNRTIETTTMTSGPYKYDFTISSRENKERIKNEKSKEKNDPDDEYETSFSNVTPNPSTLTTHAKNSNYNSNNDRVLSTIESPNLNKNPQNDAPEKENSFLDILVGSEDHKSLVTKETEDGIVTSAILPPWYESSNNHSSFNNNTDIQTLDQLHDEREEEEERESSSSDEPEDSNKSDAEPSASSSVLGGILDFFKNLPRNKPTEEHNPKRIVLKRPGEPMPKGPIKDQKSNDESVNNDGVNINTILPSNIMSTSTTTITPEVVTNDDDIEPANNVFHIGSPDGGTNIYGYYPDEDKDNDKTVEHHMVQSETISNAEDLMKKVETNPGEEENPSHSIEVQINSDASSEVVIEPEEEEDEYPYTMRYGETQAGSEVRKHIVQPPPASSLPKTRQGGGIRRPISNGELPSTTNANSREDLEMKGSENKPIYSNTQTRNIPPQLMRQRRPFINRVISTSKPVPNASENIGDIHIPNSSVSAEVTDNSAERDPPQNQDFGVKNMEHVPNGDSGEEGIQQSHEKHQNQEQFPTSGSYEHYESSGVGSSETQPKWSRPDLNVMDHLSNEQEHGGETAIGSEEVKVNPNVGDENDVLERKPVVYLDQKMYPDSSGISLEEQKKVIQVFPVGYTESTTTTTSERPPLDESVISQPENLSLDDEDEENKSLQGFIPPTPVNFHENKYTFAPTGASDSVYQSKDGWRPLVYNSDEAGGSSGPSTQPTPLPPWKIPPTVSPRLEQPPVAIADSQSSAQQHEFHEESHENHEHQQQQPSWTQTHQNGNVEQSVEMNHPMVHSQEQIQNTQNVYHHNNIHPPTIQRIPVQPPVIHHHPQQQSNQQRPHHQYGNPNIIDRSKYMMRPAPPPIMMRRPPMSYHQTFPQRPQLIPHVQQPNPNQYMNNNNNNNINAPHQEYANSPQNLINRRRFKTLGARPRSNSGNWEESKTAAE